MNTKPISPKIHGISDYVLVASLFVVPPILGFGKSIRKLYCLEAVPLLLYVALTDHPTAVTPVIPFKTHGRIDPFNAAQFALQSFWKPFRKDKKAMLFNIGFTAITTVMVLLTDWEGKTRR